MQEHKDKYITFWLGRELYGIGINYVAEIIRMVPVTHLPQAPQAIKGLINLRGSIIPVIDGRMKLGKESIEYDDRTCIIILQMQDNAVGLIVDRVDEVLVIPEEQIELLTNRYEGNANGYIKGIGKVNDTIQLLLNCEKLIVS